MSVPLPTFTPGSVWLVGAGPGDPGLLTLLAAHALAEADIVLYDALVNTDALALMGPHGRAFSVGRRKGRVTATVAQTIELMLRHAAAGRRVVRLKGGDPFIFGRGGEEVAALAKAGIPFRIVPGITAGIGGLAYAGIVATRRGVNEAITFLTGHGAEGGIPQEVDWARLARGSESLVVYMGLSLLDEVAGTLLAHGRDHLTPVAIVSSASTGAQETLLTTLGESVLAARRARLAAPALVVIGAIADPKNIFQWFDPASAGAPTGSDAAALDAARG
jgi:uroporphyrin-III C-methyltransferase